MSEQNRERPMVSVIMPAYNAEDYICAAMESVLRQEASLELIVVVDCASDGTRRMAERYGGDNRVVIRDNPENLGVAESRNIGINLARGEYIAFLDADDWWQEDKLSLQLELMHRSDAVLCCTGRELMCADGSSMGKKIGVPEKITYGMLLKTNSIPCSSVLMPAETAKKYKMCCSELHEDYIFWLEVLKNEGDAVGIDLPLLKSRMSEGGKSRNKLKSAKMQWGVYGYLGLNIARKMFYFICYVYNGIKKYS